jgi:hypothetical protein
MCSSAPTANTRGQYGPVHFRSSRPLASSASVVHTASQLFQRRARLLRPRMLRRVEDQRVLEFESFYQKRSRDRSFLNRSPLPPKPMPQIPRSRRKMRRSGIRSTSFSNLVTGATVAAVATSMIASATSRCFNSRLGLGNWPFATVFRIVLSGVAMPVTHRSMKSNTATQRGTPVTLSIEAAQLNRSLQSISSIHV